MLLGCHAAVIESKEPYFARYAFLRLSPSLCLTLISPMDHMALLWTILPMNASEGVSLSRCGRQSHCMYWVRKIFNVVSPRLSNATNGTTVLHSAPSYLSTLLASISCISRFCVPEGTAPSQAKACQREFAWKECRVRPCSLRRDAAAYDRCSNPDTNGAYISARLLRGFIACQQTCRCWTSSRTGRRAAACQKVRKNYDGAPLSH